MWTWCKAKQICMVVTFFQILSRCHCRCEENVSLITVVLWQCAATTLPCLKATKFRAIALCLCSLWPLHLDTETLTVFVFFLSLKLYYVVVVALEFWLAMQLLIFLKTFFAICCSALILCSWVFRLSGRTVPLSKSERRRRRRGRSGATSSPPPPPPGGASQEKRWLINAKGQRARPGFEPGTSRTRSENHTPRPSSHRWVKRVCNQYLS